MLFAWYGQIVGAGLLLYFILPFFASLIVHACTRRYFLVVALTTIAGFIIWMTLAILSEEGITYFFDGILFISISWGIVSAIAGAPFAIIRMIQSQ